MANAILHKYSATAGAVPAAGSLTPRELSINTADGRLFTKTTGGAVQEFARQGKGMTFGNVADAGATVLDWYEEGSFTADTMDLIIQRTATVYWTRVGKLVQMCIDNPGYYESADNVSGSVTNRLNFFTGMPTHLRPTTWTLGPYGSYYNGADKGPCEWYLNATGYFYLLIKGDSAGWTPSSIRGAGGTRTVISYLLV